MLKAVIFDIDGTLGDTLDLCVESYRRCVEEHCGTRPTAAEVTAHFGLSDRGVLGKLVGMQPDDPALPIDRFQAIYESLHADMAPAPFEGAIAMLQQLKAAGLRIGIISGKEHYTAAPTIARYGFAPYIEWMGLGQPTHNCKHERLAEVMQHWQLAPDELIYVGDAPGDIELAHRAGVRIINAAWATTAAADEAACLALKPDFRLTDFSQLLPLLLSL